VPEIITVPTGQMRAASVARAVRMLANLPAGKQYVVEIKEKKPRRSNDQNALLWALYTQIIERGGEAMAGWTKEDLHEFFLGNHFGWQKLEGLGRPRMKPLRRSAGLNKQEFSDYVESIIRFMADKGVALDTPDAA